MKSKIKMSEKQNRFFSRLGFRMWLSFLLLTGVITMIFWLFLAQSVRLNYVNENVEDMDRVIWDAVAEYGAYDYYDELRLIAKAQGYYVLMLSENDEALTTVFRSDADGNNDGDIPEIVPSNLLSLLDVSHGNYRHELETGDGSVWTVHAVVTANIEGNRQILFMGKSLIRVDEMLLILRKRAVYAFLGALGISLLLSLLLTRVFAEPIERLTKRAQRLAERDYSVNFPQEGYYEVRELSETMNLAAQEFQATEKMRREFIANISHDMRTPLTVIKMYTEMIQTVSGDNPEKRAVHLERIQAETDKLSVMINATMELSKLQSGTFPVEMKVFNLTHLIRSAAASCSAQNEENVEIVLKVEENLSVFADRKLIGRVLQNFISNALKFSIHEKRIIVRAFQKRSVIRTEVQDFGPGIKKEDIPLIWDRYYTVNPYGNNRMGTGLGLNIAATVLTIHEADYGVESEEGKGSMFWFELPIREGEDA